MVTGYAKESWSVTSAIALKYLKKNVLRSLLSFSLGYLKAFIEEISYFIEFMTVIANLENKYSKKEFPLSR